MTEVPTEEAFRQEVLTFLRATLPPKGDEESGVVSFGGSGLSRSVAYQRQLADAGLAGITWPVEYGGRGLPGRYQRIYDREAKAFQVPPRSLEIGLGMCGPTLLVHASEEQKRTFIPPLLRGEHVWCELFSEPGAGSDLSSVQTRARRDGGRVRAPRAEGVDVGRPAQRLRRLPRAHRSGAAQARGHHHAHRRHARAGHHGAAAAPDHRRVPLQRGLPRRGAGAGGQRRRRGQRRLARGPHHARLRAPGPGQHGRRWRRQGRLHRAGGGGQAARPGVAARLRATAWCSCASARWSCATSPATCR